MGQITGIIPPDATIAGGIRLAEQTFTVNHNQLSGNTQGKIIRLQEMLADVLDDRFQITGPGATFPPDDPDHPDSPDNPGTYNTYGDLYERPNGSWIDEATYYWQQNPQRLWIVYRNTVAQIILEVENDPTLGGNDRYAIRQFPGA